jgi:hypothetical protein
MYIREYKYARSQDKLDAPISDGLRAVGRYHPQCLAPLEVAVRRVERLVQRHDLAMDRFVEFALPLGTATFGAFVAVENATSEWSFLMLAAERATCGVVRVRHEIRAIAAVSRGSDVEYAQGVRGARLSCGVDPRDDKRGLKPRDIHPMSELLKVAARA